MTDSLFREGGPHKIRRTDAEKFEATVSLPEDASGMIGRACTSAACSPAYFKIKPGTGLTSEQATSYCPYCRQADNPKSFFTPEQERFAQDLLIREAEHGVKRMMSAALGLDSSGRRKIGQGMFSIEMSLKQGSSLPVSRPVEEELRRDLICEVCTLEHSVFGLATWCPDCGADVFLQHLHEELSVTRRILGAAEMRRSSLDARVAARDVENALEDLVSLFETVLKHATNKHLVSVGTSGRR